MSHNSLTQGGAEPVQGISPKVCPCFELSPRQVVLQCAMVSCRSVYAVLPRELRVGSRKMCA